MILKKEILLLQVHTRTHAHAHAHARTCVSLEELQQGADGRHSGRHVRVRPHLRPEVLHQL